MNCPLDSLSSLARLEQALNGLVSEDGLAAIARTLRSAEYADPTVIAGAAAGGGDSLRQRVRFTLALLPVASPQTVLSVLGNTRLDLEDASGLVSGGAAEAPLTVLHAVTRSLRDGATAREAAEETGVSVRTVERLAAFLGIDTARREAIERAAYLWAFEELSLAVFAKEHGLTGAAAREAWRQTLLASHRMLTSIQQFLLDGGSAATGLAQEVKVSARSARTYLAAARDAVREVEGVAA